jgi:hypothetical protein
MASAGRDGGGGVMATCTIASPMLIGFGRSQTELLFRKIPGLDLNVGHMGSKSILFRRLDPLLPLLRGMSQQRARNCPV